MSLKKKKVLRRPARRSTYHLLITFISEALVEGKGGEERTRRGNEASHKQSRKVVSGGPLAIRIRGRIGQPEQVYLERKIQTIQDVC